MNQDALLKLIAETGFNVGYAAKKHLATFDMVEKLPGWIGLASLAVGIYALFVPALEEKHVAAAFKRTVDHHERRYLYGQTHNAI